MADVTLSVGFAFQKQDINESVEKLESAFSDLQLRTDLPENLKKDINTCMGMISGFQKYMVRQLSQMDLSAVDVTDFTKSIINELGEVEDPIRNLIKEVQKIDSSFDPKPLLDNLFNFKSSMLSLGDTFVKVAKAAESAGVAVKFEGDANAQIESIIHVLEKLRQQISETNLNSLANDFAKSLKTTEDVEKAYDELADSYSKVNAQIKIYRGYLVQAEKTGASDNEKLALELEYRDFLRQRLELLVKINRLDSEIGPEKESFFNTEEGKAAEKILDNLSQNVLNLISNYETLTGKYKNFQVALNSGIELPLLSQKDANKITNTGVINVAAQLKITTSAEDMWLIIKERLDEVQALVESEHVIVVPIRYVDKTNESATAQAKSVSDEYAFDFNETYEYIEKKAIETATETAKNAIEEIRKTFNDSENTIAVHLDIPDDEIDKINAKLKKDELEGKIDFSSALDEAKEKAENLLTAFKNINDELIESAQKRNELNTDYSSKYADETLQQQVAQATERAEKAIEELNEIFVKKPIVIQFDIQESLKNLEAAIEEQNLSGQLDITDNLKKAISMTDELVTHLKGIESIDFKANFLTAIDLGNLISQVEQIATLLAGIDTQLKQMQAIDFTIGVPDVKFDFSDVLSYFERITNAIEQMSTALANSSAVSSFQDFADLLDNISTKVQNVKDDINSIKINNQVVNGFKNLNSALSNVKNLSTSSLKNVADALERVNAVNAEHAKDVFSSFKAITKTNVENISRIAPALKDLKKELDALDKTDYKGFLYQIESILKNADALKALSTVITTSKKQIEGLGTGFKDVDREYATRIDKIKSSLEGLQRESNVRKYMPQYKDLLNELDALIREYEKLSSISPFLRFNSDNKRLKDIEKRIIDINYQLQETDRIVQNPTRTNAIKKINTFLRDSSKLTQEEREQLEQLIKLLNNPNLSMSEYREIMTTFNQISASAIKAGRASSSFFDAVRNKLKYGWAQTFATFFSFYDIIRYMREVSSTVAQLNSSLIELAKVSEASVGELYADFNDFAQIAKETGGTINDIVNMTAGWARNGFNLPDSKELARVSSIFQNIGDGISAAQSNEYLVSTLKGFRLEADSAIEIIDKINNVSNNAASGVSDIGEALERSSSAFGAANTSLSKSIALLTTAKQHWLYVQKCA